MQRRSDRRLQSVGFPLHRRWSHRMATWCLGRAGPADPAGLAVARMVVRIVAVAKTVAAGIVVAETVAAVARRAVVAVGCQAAAPAAAQVAARISVYSRTATAGY